MKYTINGILGIIDAEPNTNINQEVLNLVVGSLKCHGAYIRRNIIAPTEPLQFDLDIRQTVNDDKVCQSFTLNVHDPNDLGSIDAEYDYNRV